MLAVLRSEKESLESNLYNSQQTISQLEISRQQLETENRELIQRKETLQGTLFQIIYYDRLKTSLRL